MQEPVIDEQSSQILNGDKISLKYDKDKVTLGVARSDASNPMKLTVTHKIEFSREQFTRLLKSFQTVASRLFENTQYNHDYKLNYNIIELYLGFNLITLADPSKQGTLRENIHEIRNQLFNDYGVVIPTISIKDKPALHPNEYALYLHGVEVCSDRVYPEKLLLINPSNLPLKFEGEDVKEPAFKHPARWINPKDHEKAEQQGHTVVNAETAVISHIKEALKKHKHELFGYDELAFILSELKKAAPETVEQLTAKVPMQLILETARNLLEEYISIRDFKIIAEALIANISASKDPEKITAAVRISIRKKISAALKDKNGIINAIQLDPAYEEHIRNIYSKQNPAPEEMSLIETPLMGSMMEHMLSTPYYPVILTSADMRRLVYSVISKYIADASVMTMSEIGDEKLRILGVVKE